MVRGSGAVGTTPVAKARAKPAVTKAAAPATVRTLHLTNPYMTGSDVAEAQVLLSDNRFGDFAPGAADGVYGPATAEAARKAKFALGYPDKQVDGAFDPVLLDYLGGKAVPAGFAGRVTQRQQKLAEQEPLRQKIVDVALWGIKNEAQIHYQQLRPIDGLGMPMQLPLKTDCSGFSTLCYRWAGASDPNGLNFSGQGYTGTMLKACRQIAQSAAQPGDLVVWGAYPGHHVALVLESGADPLLCSHGQEKGPVAIRFSVETAYQKAPATWLTCLPA